VPVSARTACRITPSHQALRRHADHLVDHLAGVHVLLAGVPTEADHWHASAVTVAADWAAFGAADLHEAAERLRRLAHTYQLVYTSAGPAAWDASRTQLDPSGASPSTSGGPGTPSRSATSPAVAIAPGWATPAGPRPS